MSDVFSRLKMADIARFSCTAVLAILRLKGSVRLARYLVKVALGEVLHAKNESH